MSNELQAYYPFVKSRFSKKKLCFLTVNSCLFEMFLRIQSRERFKQNILFLQHFFASAYKKLERDVFLQPYSLFIQMNKVFYVNNLSLKIQRVNKKRFHLLTF
jgi:hypothetical protein